MSIPCVVFISLLFYPWLPPRPPLWHTLWFILFFPVLRAFVPLAVFVLVNHHFPVVLGESTCRKWGESTATKGKAWSGSKLGWAGDAARELLPWTARPGTQKNLDPEHPLARDSRGRRLALVLYPCLIQVVLCRVLALCASHPLPIPRGPSCPLARHEWF
jgi:hypothetical protein